MRPARVLVAVLAVSVVSLGADCGGLAGTDWEPQTLALSQSSYGEVLLSLTDATGTAACDSAEASATLSSARQLLVNLGTEPFESESSLAATVTDKQWDAASNVTTSVDTGGTYHVSASSCSTGCVIEIDVTVDGAARLLLVELAAGDYPRCLNAGEFTYGRL